MKCKHFSRVSWDHFPYSKTISTLFLKYQRTKATCFCTPDPSVLQSIPFYFYLIMQGNICLSSSSLACGWNIRQYIIASTSRNSFKWILRLSLLCLLLHRALIGKEFCRVGTMSVCCHSEIIAGCCEWDSLKKTPGNRGKILESKFSKPHLDALSLLCWALLVCVVSATEPLNRTLDFPLSKNSTQAHLLITWVFGEKALGDSS